MLEGLKTESTWLEKTTVECLLSAAEAGLGPDRSRYSRPGRGCLIRQAWACYRTAMPAHVFRNHIL